MTAHLQSSAQGIGVGKCAALILRKVGNRLTKQNAHAIEPRCRSFTYHDSDLLTNAVIGSIVYF